MEYITKYRLALKSYKVFNYVYKKLLKSRKEFININE